MFNFILISIVIAPVLAGMLFATDRRMARGLLLLLFFLVVYDVLYIALLHYLRHRWVG